MFDLQLSKHFMLSDFLKSNIANEFGINNYPTFRIISNLQQVCLNVLEPIVEHFGSPLKILAGYQCTEILQHLGLYHDSQHLNGEAVDFVFDLPDTKDRLDSLLQVFGWMCDHVPYDELYMEYLLLPEKQKPHRRIRIKVKNHGPRYFFWVHVSYRSLTENRHQRRCPVSL